MKFVTKSGEVGLRLSFWPGTKISTRSVAVKILHSEFVQDGNDIQKRFLG